MRTLLFIPFLMLPVAGVNAQKLTRTEKKIAAAVTRNAPAAIAFLEKVVDINSGTLNLKGVRAGRERQTSLLSPNTSPASMVLAAWAGEPIPRRKPST